MQQQHQQVQQPNPAARRLSAASPRLKRSQCLSVQAPLHGNPQEYHLVPSGTLRPNVPSTSPRPGRSPSPGTVETRFQYSPQPYQKFPPPHFQPPVPPGYPITTQPVSHFQLPPAGHYQNPPRSFHTHGYPTLPNPARVKTQPYPMEDSSGYPTLPTSPRFKLDNSGYPTLPASPRIKPGYPMDDSALVTRPYPNFCLPDGYAYQMDEFSKVQDAEYGVVSPTSLQFRSGSIPAQMQNSEGPDMGGLQPHLNRSVPSINIIPSTSPPRVSYVTNVEGWRGMTTNFV